MPELVTTGTATVAHDGAVELTLVIDGRLRTLSFPSRVATRLALEIVDRLVAQVDRATPPA